MGAGPGRFQFNPEGTRFRVFAHPQAALEGAVEAGGLARASERNGPLFRIVAFERV